MLRESSTNSRPPMLCMINLTKSITNRDAYKEGFLVEGRVEEKSVDAIFLDLPSPWLAVEQCVKAIKTGGR